MVMSSLLSKQNSDILSIILKVAACIAVCLLLSSCGKRKHQELLTIPVNFSQDISFPISEIVEDVREIKLELTDKSLLRRIRRVTWDAEHVIVLDLSGVFLFDTNGKFIRCIGYKGQGPGEYLNIVDMTVDFKNRHIYIADTRKLLCYDFDNNYKEEYSNSTLGSTVYLNYVNNNLMLIKEEYGEKEGENRIHRSTFYKTDAKSQITDSVDIRKIINPLMAWSKPWADFITFDNERLCLYYPQLNPEPSLRDTVFIVDKNRLIPHYRLDFQHSGMGGDGKRMIFLFNIWKSSRFVFSVYGKTDTMEEYFRFCYDIIKQKGYTMKDGYFDDLYTGEKVDIRPLNYNPEKVYYTHTYIYDDQSLEEPNPTLYIGVLKK